MATHSSILAWRIPWTEEPGGLQSVGYQRIRHDWVTNTHIISEFSKPLNIRPLTKIDFIFRNECLGNENENVIYNCIKNLNV